MFRNTIHCLIVTSFIILSLSQGIAKVSALEAKFTPAPDKDTGSTDGPLPLSQNQRNQLLQLDQQIAQSANPQETLQKVAESNGMSANELGDLLMRNRRDMQMAGGGGGGGGGFGVADSLPRKMLRLISTMFLIGLKSASAHPRSAIITGLLLFSMLYIFLSAPRTGIVLSTGNGIFSSCHTTFLPPPTRYLSKYVNKVSHKSSLPDTVKAGSLSRIFTDDNIDDIGDDGVQIKKLTKDEKKKLSQVLTIKKELPFAVLLPSEEELELMHEKETGHLNEGEVDENSMAMVEDKAWEHAIDLTYTSACRIINKRRFSEFVPSPANQLRIYSEPRKSETHKDIAALAMKSMGNYRRFGIQPLRVASEFESDTVKSVVYYTLKGGRFDGELKISIVRSEEGDDDNEGAEPSVVLTATLLVPKKGRSMKTKMGAKMLSLLVESIAISSITEAKQILSRELQSTIYRGRAKTRAAEKRHIAFENMKKMEEMAAERRRKWIRNNPGTSGYRPSGHMMRGPGGGPARSF